MKLEIKDQSYMEICNFLFHEADLLDTGAFREWLSLMTDDLVYRIPLRVTKEVGQGFGFLDSMSHMDDTFYTLEKRVHRLESEYAWAEIPPSRTRHFVSNIRVRPGGNDSEVQVDSNLLFLPQSRGFSGFRHPVRETARCSALGRRQLEIGETHGTSGSDYLGDAQSVIFFM